MRSTLLLILALALAASLGSAGPTREAAPEGIRTPKWVRGVSRMAFLTPGQVEEAHRLGVQVVHTNLVWPYYPLRRDGGGLAPEDDRALRNLADGCRRRGMKLCLGLPPFPSVALARAHPQWRVHPEDAPLNLDPREDDLASRVGCNVGPWGDYLIQVCVELVRDYGIDGFSFDGNYAPPICFCPACKSAYRKDAGAAIPHRAHLDSVEYRHYLTWRGERLEAHYARMQRALKTADPEAVLMSWTVNAGRYGHLLHTPRAMPTRLNRLFDLPMQEWWLDETNFGGSIAPSFGAAYLRAVRGDGPCASEPYLMSRGNPYGTHSFPRHERLTRALLATTYGCLSPESLGWPGHRESTGPVLAEIRKREPWLLNTRRLPWAAMLVSEQTRQFYAYPNIPELYLPHLFGAFRAATEEHLAISLINDWDVSPAELARYAVLVIPNGAALSDPQVEAIRAYVRQGGGLVATVETSLFDELGRRRKDFGLADAFGVSYLGKPAESANRTELDPNFAVAVGPDYWRQRTGIATLTWADHPLTRDGRLAELVPTRSVLFRGPQARVSEPAAGEAAVRLQAEGEGASSPGIVCRSFGKGRVAYLAAGADAAMWSYSFPYQRRLLARAIEWAASRPAPLRVEAPMCVQASAFTQKTAAGGERLVLHLFNGIDTAARHGLPAAEVPLREETLPVHGIRVHVPSGRFSRARVQPGDLKPAVRKLGRGTLITLPPLSRHAMLVLEPA